jgi:hypothetical protein
LEFELHPLVGGFELGALGGELLFEVGLLGLGGGEIALEGKEALGLALVLGFELVAVRLDLADAGFSGGDLLLELGDFTLKGGELGGVEGGLVL